MNLVGRSFVLVLVLLAACGDEPEPSPPPEDPGVVTDRVARALGQRVTREVDCAASPIRFACELAGIPGEPFELPSSPITRVGMHFAVRPSRTIEEGMLETVRVARLDLGPSGISLLRLDLVTDENLGARELRTNAVLASDGTAAAVDVPPPLVAGLAQDIPERVALEHDALGWRYQAAGDIVGRLWHVPAHDGRPAHWVAVEPVRGGDAGSIVTIFPDVPWRPAGEATEDPLALPAPEGQGPPPGTTP